MLPGQGGASVWLSNKDGTFTGSTFYPYAAYPYPLVEGTFLVGDFNGDGKQDILHILPQLAANVVGFASAYVWFSNGDGTFNVVASPAINDPPVEGPWLVGDFNGDGMVDIMQVLTGGDAVQTWISQGDGSFVANPYPPWNGYPIKSGTWLVGDINGDGAADLVHLPPDVRYLYTWRSQLGLTLNALIVQNGELVDDKEGPGP
jgi:hypothetical protein